MRAGVLIRLKPENAYWTLKQESYQFVNPTLIDFEPKMGPQSGAFSKLIVSC